MGPAPAATASTELNLLDRVGSAGSVGRRPPVEPPASRFAFTAPRGPRFAAEQDLLASGADLEPGTVLSAYRAGYFPMGLGDDGQPPWGWWSPDPRGVLPLDGLHVSRSLRRSLKGFEIRTDTAFDEVVAACADPARDGAWISPAIVDTYGRLHRAGWAHSVEVWQDETLVGGLYGLAIGGLFAGESMFHRATDASKVALVGLVDLLRAAEAADPPGSPRRLLDVQWRTDHLATLGVVEIARSDYLDRLDAALTLPSPFD